MKLHHVNCVFTLGRQGRDVDQTTRHPGPVLVARGKGWEDTQ